VRSQQPIACGPQKRVTELPPIGQVFFQHLLDRVGAGAPVVE